MLSVALRRIVTATPRVSLWTRRPPTWRPSSLSGSPFSSRFFPDNFGRLQPHGFISITQKTPRFNGLITSQHFHSSAARLKKRDRPEPPPRELDLVRYDMKHLWEGPKPALCLGFAGLIPFVSPPLIMAATETFYPELAYAQLAYAAAIISFLGGSRWGFALPDSSPAEPDWINLANSVVPPLLAWAAMLLSNSLVPAAMMAIVGLGVSLHYDLSLLPTYPSWFKALRTVLTVTAFFSLLGTILMNGSFPEKYFF
ncbi:transmembrane protein 69-like [Poecilia formosa]|uniref:Transmembrane protein 69 n=1 Tax=Poecilia formosa TaxID=48698 RepID=A0A087YMX0_POEFO|nr:PREDICTED: transmembrane protein 69-like [Poecilia formosa]XP_007576959.1 PREDICTED: transmembrane protein 69-like [Poecilia formosa]